MADLPPTPGLEPLDCFVVYIPWVAPHGVVYGDLGDAMDLIECEEEEDRDQCSVTVMQFTDEERDAMPEFEA